MFHRYLPFSFIMQRHSNFLIDARQWTKDRNTLSFNRLEGFYFYSKFSRKIFGEISTQF